MPHFAWAKIFCDLLRHPLLRDRPDCDVRLVIGLILEAKEHSDDGVIRNLTPASARGLCHIKASTASVKAGLEYLVTEGWLIPHPDQAYEIRDFKDRQAADSAADRMRRLRDRKRDEQSDETVTKRHEQVTPIVTVASPEVEVEEEVDKSKNLAPAEKPPVLVPKTRATRQAYETAYREKYGAEPLPQARKTNGQLAQFVELVGADLAPRLAAFYVQQNDPRYAKARHPIGLLFQDAERLFGDMNQGRAMTNTEARRADETQAKSDVFSKFLTGGANAVGTK